MKTYHLKKKQFLAIRLQDAWEFFSSPKNLGTITPPRMNFKIVSLDGGYKMHEGQIIGYEVTVLPLVRLYWETQIISVKENQFFIDLQRKGPYSQWVHKHSFAEVSGGIEMTDELEYALPFGLLGRVANFLFVSREVKRIFNYRSVVLESLFNRIG